MKMKNSILIILIIALLSACNGSYTTSAFTVRGGISRDKIHSIDTTNSGAIKIWLNLDDVAFYCVMPEEAKMINAAYTIQQHGSSAMIYRQSLTYTSPISDVKNNPCGYPHTSGSYELLNDSSGNTYYLAQNAYRIIGIAEIAGTSDMKNADFLPVFAGNVGR